MKLLLVSEIFLSAFERFWRSTARAGNEYEESDMRFFLQSKALAQRTLAVKTMARFGAVRIFAAFETEAESTY